jgi:signal peptidase
VSIVTEPPRPDSLSQQQLDAQIAELTAQRDALAAEAAEPAKPKGVLHYLGIGVSAGLLALVVLVALLVVIVPMVTGSRALTVLTSSMVPTYPPGTLVIVKPTAPADIRVGDVLTYQLESGKDVLVTHRVIDKATNADTGALTFITQGDANDLADDPPVREVQVVGTVWYAVPYIGWVNNAVNGDLRPLIIPIVVGLLFAYALWMIISGARDRVKKRRAVTPAS